MYRTIDPHVYVQLYGEVNLSQYIIIIYSSYEYVTTIFSGKKVFLNVCDLTDA